MNGMKLIVNILEKQENAFSKKMCSNILERDEKHLTLNQPKSTLEKVETIII